MGFGVLFLNFFLWLYSLISLDLNDIQVLPRGRSMVVGLGVSLFLIVLLNLRLSDRWRILPQETNLLAVSSTMFEKHSISLPTEEIRRMFGPPALVHQESFSEPLLFPFLTSLFHAIFGYRPTNAFLVNDIIGFFVLFLFYLLLRHFYAMVPAIAGMMLLCAHPLVGVGIQSGCGYVVQVGFFLLVLEALFLFFSHPTPRLFPFCLLTLLLWAHTGNIFILPAIFLSMLVIQRFPVKEWPETSFLLLALPFLWLSIIGQRAPDFSLKDLQFLFFKGMIFLPVLVALCMASLQKILELFKASTSWVIVFSLVHIIWYGVVAWQPPPAQTLSLEVQTVKEFVEARKPFKNFVIVCPVPQLFTPFRLNAISFPNIWKYQSGLRELVRKREIEEFLVIQKVRTRLEKPIWQHPFDLEGDISTLLEFSTSNGNWIRVLSFPTTENLRGSI